MVLWCTAARPARVLRVLDGVCCCASLIWRQPGFVIHIFLVRTAWRLNKKLGVVALLLYIVYMAFGIMMEMEIVTL